MVHRGLDLYPDFAVNRGDCGKLVHDNAVAGRVSGLEGNNCRLGGALGRAGIGQMLHRPLAGSGGGAEDGCQDGDDHQRGEHIDKNPTTGTFRHNQCPPCWRNAMWEVNMAIGCIRLTATNPTASPSIRTMSGTSAACMTARARLNRYW